MALVTNQINMICLLVWRIRNDYLLRLKFISFLIVRNSFGSVNNESPSAVAKKLIVWSP